MRVEVGGVGVERKKEGRRRNCLLFEGTVRLALA